MTNEEFSRKMEFIVAQRAQFALDMQRLKETQDRNQQQINDLRGALSEAVRLQSEYQEQAKREFAELAEARKKTEASHSTTDERLQVLIAVIKNYFRKRHGGDDEAAVPA